MIASLESEAIRRGAIAAQALKESGIKTILVAPLPDVLPDDGLLQYTAVTSVYDLPSVPDRSVALFDVQKDLDLLRLIQNNGPLLGVDTKVLVGLPTAEYTTSFDEAVWQSDRVAYAPLLSELSIATEVAAQTAVKKMTQHDHERAQYTRRDGSVKVDERVVLASSMDKSDVSSEDDESGDDA